MVTKKILIRKAIREFISNDKSDLLRVDIYEPTLSHRIAVYLGKQFPDYNVDCEYNKNLEGNKKNVDGKKIRPDIIIHKRGTSENCIIIEIKKA